MTQQATAESFDKSFADARGALSRATGNTVAEPVLKLREEAFARFTELGIPTTKVEDWRYTNVQGLKKGSYAIASNAPTASIQEKLVPGLDSYVCTILDGSYVAALSKLPKAAGVSVRPIGDLCADASNEQLAEYLSGGAQLATHPFAALNAATFTAGIHIQVAPKTVLDKPIQIAIVNTGGTARAMQPIRTIIEAGARSEVRVIESYTGPDEDAYFTCAVTDVNCAEESIVEHTKIQLEGKASTHIGLLRVDQAAKSRFTSNVFAFGGGTVRNEIHPALNGENIESFLNGLTVIGGSQHVDNTTVIDHAMPNCFSRELYKGIYSDKSSGAFSGTIIVRQDAQKTNAIQSNNSLLLSTEASIDSRPQLKIWADDVKCTHGATVGQLDENAMFYLRSRGIPQLTARNMLIHAFASDIVSHVADEPVREHLQALLLSRLGE